MAIVYGKYSSKLNFWKSRYARLFPTYFICAILTLLLVKNTSMFFEDLFSLPISAVIFLIFTNLTMFFQDLTMFLAIQDGSLHLTKNFAESTPMLFTLLLVPQAWSIGLEIAFYMLVPFLMPRSKYFLLGIALCSVLIKLALWEYGFTKDPWTYRFFFSELYLFIFGSLSYKVYTEYFSQFSNKYGLIALCLVITYICLFPLLPIELFYKKYLLIALLVLCLGFIFDFTKNIKFDHFVGQLSYPIYISHLMLLPYFLPKLPYLRDSGNVVSTIGIYLLVIFFSTILYFLVERSFLEKFRMRYKK